MDIATVLGYLLGFGLIVWSMSHGGGLAALKLFVHVPAAAVVCGGSFAAILIHFPIGDVKNVFKVILKNFVNRLPEPDEQIEQIVEYANLARKEGLLALESKVKDVDDRFFAKGLQLVIDGFSASRCATSSSSTPRSRNSATRSASRCCSNSAPSHRPSEWSRR